MLVQLLKTTREIISLLAVCAPRVTLAIGPIHPPRDLSRAMVLSKSLDERMALLKVQQVAWIAQSRSADPRLVQLRDMIRSFLLEHGLAWEQIVHPTKTGVHPRNRSGILVDPVEVLRKLKAFLKHGFSMKECERAVAVASSKPSLESTNIELVNQSAGQLAPVEPGALIQYSLTCSHTNQALRMVLSGVDCDDPDLCQPGSTRISRTKLEENDAQLKEALTQGMQWFVLHQRVDDECEEIIDILMEADNIPLGVAKQDSQVMTMFKIHGMAKGRRDSLAADPVAGWNDIKRTLQNTSGSDQEGLPELIKFVKEVSGGLETPWVLQDLNRFLRTLTINHSWPPSVLVKLADSTLDVWLRIALLKATSASPRQVGNEARWLSPSDINTLQQKNRQFADSAAVAMKAGKIVPDKLTMHAQAELAKGNSIDVNDLLKCFDHFQIRLASHIVMRPIGVGTVSPYKSLHEIGALFRDDCESCFPDSCYSQDLVAWPPLWVHATPGTAAASPARPRSAAIPDISEDTGKISHESLLERLAEKGCAVGSSCVNKKDATLWRVTEILSDTVTLASSKNETQQLKIPTREIFDKCTFPLNVAKDYSAYTLT